MVEFKKKKQTKKNSPAGKRFSSYEHVSVHRSKSLKFFQILIFNHVYSKYKGFDRFSFRTVCKPQYNNWPAGVSKASGLLTNVNNKPERVHY